MKRMRVIRIVSFIAFLTVVLVVNGTTYTVTSTADTGPGSLRTAMQSANTNAGADTIVFNISGTGVQTIRPQSALPTLTDQMGVFINGLSQPGSSVGTNAPATATLQIHLNGAQAGACHGIYILSSFNRIQGLVIDSFQQDGIRIEGTALPGTHNNTVYCCFLGTDPAGTSDWGNGWNNLSLWSGVNIIVVPNANPTFCFANTVDRCLSSGNYSEGVQISSCPPGDCYNNTVSYCYLGTDITGLLDRGNDHTGVCIAEGAHDNNVNNCIISGNDYEGVSIIGYVSPPLQIFTNNNIVQSNIIGLGSDGQTVLGNTRSGVSIGTYGPSSAFSNMGHAQNNIVQSNTIARNFWNGVQVWEHSYTNNNADGNRISQNQFYNNTRLAIDLGDNLVTMNDPADMDAGANQELNFPVIQLAYDCGGGQAYLSGTLSIGGNPVNSSIEIYLARADQYGYGEGRAYVTTINPSSTGSWTTTTTGIVQSDTVTAITIDTTGNTSEFSAILVVSQGVNITETHNNVSCYGSSDASIDVSVSGGTSPYTYLWSTSQTTQDLINLPPGTYIITVTDANSCQDTMSISITQPPQIVITGTSTDPSSWGASDGIIDISVSGGTPTYVYSWSDGSTTQDLNGVQAGVYCVTVTDAAGCIMTWCDTLNYPQNIDENVAESLHFSMHPNPAEQTSILKILTSEVGEVELTLFDQLGKKICGLKIEVVPEVVSEIPWKTLAGKLPPGIYYLCLNQSGNVATTKVAVK